MSFSRWNPTRWLRAFNRRRTEKPTSNEAPKRYGKARPANAAKLHHRHSAFFELP